MTRQEELVWASAWAASLRATRTANRPRDVRIEIARGDAAESVLVLREQADDPDALASDSEGYVLLRQMAGEPDCFMQRKPPTECPGVYLMCENPQVERCEMCHVFGGWKKEEERCPICGAIPDLTRVEAWGTVYACCGSAWVGGAADPPEKTP